MIQILHTSHNSFSSAFETILMRGKQDMQEAAKKAEVLLHEVCTFGFEALLKQIERFDNWNPTTLQDIIISKEQCLEAYNALDSVTKENLHIAYDRIYAFHQKQKQKSWFDFEPNGSILGQIYTPIERVGLYIPGGKAAYPSSLLMNAIPAIVAGVGEIVVCTPTPYANTNPVLLAALHICGISEIYKLGGVSAIGLMAYGLEDPHIKKTDFISGPGNIFVAAAKKLVFGEVGIDMIAGPSEIAIIADSCANSKYIAYDLLSQAEHDEMASSFLFVSDEGLAKEVSKHIEEILPTLPRSVIAQASIQNRGAIIVCKDLQESIALCNALAPEHLEILVPNAFELLPSIKHAGAIFLGEYSPEPMGDYLAGPNHTLPTGGSARFFSPLGVDNFVKKSSLISLSATAMCELGSSCAHLAHLENLDAHSLAVQARLTNKQYKEQ